MNNITQDLKDSAASVLNDPFNLGSMTRFTTFCSKSDFDGSWSYHGTVAFKNGDTQGEQKFRGDSLNGLLLKMQAFVETLEGGK